jgi:hypothetical protein
MSLLGKAALAMWWDMAPEIRPDFEHWHTHEHFPERLGLPGFRRASRWRSDAGGEGFFVMYELDDHTTLSSAPYLARLNAPTPWSTRLMPHHRNMVRSQCRVLASAGSSVSGHALTVRMANTDGASEPPVAEFERLCRLLASSPGLVGAHVLRHEQPAIGPTTEQRIRGDGDQVADCVFVACGYESASVAAVLQHEALQAVLAAAQISPTRHGLYRLCHSAVPADVAGAGVIAAAEAAVRAESARPIPERSS